MAQARPPVVGIFGHIDHGKSTLLDYIRKTNITEKEAGGITQHISAYEVVHKSAEGKESRITFLDTPGHEAFKGVRTRGAGAADVAVLVVSAEDGVKPQTTEALGQIQESGIPYIVALTKIDKPAADVERTKQNLAENNIYVEGYGGDISYVPVSAKTGQGVSDLLDTIVLVAELEGYSAEKNAPGSGVIIESFLDPRKGITATGIIKSGTVRKGDFAATSGAIAPLRFLEDFEGRSVEDLSFSSPVVMTGWYKLPKAGAVFQTFTSKSEALDFAAREEEADRGKTVMSQATLKEGVTALPLIIKADTAGSLDAIVYEVGKLERERIAPQVVLAGVGTVSEGDIKTCLSAPGAVVLSFNTKTDALAAALAERSGIEIFSFNIIYELTEKVKNLLEEKEPRIEVEEATGSAKVLRLFSKVKNKQVMGGRVLSGTIERGATVRIMRRDSEIGKGSVKELQKAKSDVNSVMEGEEFGTLVESKTEIATGDVLEAVVKVTR